MQILRAPTAFLNAIIAAPANLRLYYSSSYGQPAVAGQANWVPVNTLIAQGAAVTPFINAGSRILTGLPTYANPALALNARAYRLVIPAGQGMPGAVGGNFPRDIELGEFCECVAADPVDLLALGFTAYTPTNAVPIPQIYG
jgi:hypothetical protein